MGASAVGAPCAVGGVSGAGGRQVSASVERLSAVGAARVPKRGTLAELADAWPSRQEGSGSMQRQGPHKQLLQLHSMETHEVLQQCFLSSARGFPALLSVQELGTVQGCRARTVREEGGVC